MFARASEWSVPPERQDEALHTAEEHIGPALSKQQPGALRLRASSSTAQLLRVDPKEERAATDVSPKKGWRQRNWWCW
jgi:hypothetical protein